MIRLLTLVTFLMLGSAQAETMRLAVTTSFHNSGLSDLLLPAIKADTGIDVQLLVVGTGQALRLGQAGDVDAILVHAKAAEEKFVAAGFATHRRRIMYNDFVVIGPADDVAHVKQAADARDAFQRIVRSEYDFVSRGDDSGTHKKEQSLWRAAQLNPEQFASWYKSLGMGMGASLNTAAGLNAYILADRASWLNFGNKTDLALLYSGDPVLFNQYAFLPINPAQHPHVKHAAARILEKWLTNSAAQTLVNTYKIAGQQLFVHNAHSE